MTSDAAAGPIAPEAAVGATPLPPAARLDLRGLSCPLPVLKTRKWLMGMAPGGVLLLLTSDPLAGIDIPAFCHEAGHRLLEAEREADGHRFLIARGPRTAAASHEAD